MHKKATPEAAGKSGQEGKNMKGTKKYIEQREIFGSKDQALDFIAANKVLLISLREKDGMWCLKYLQYLQEA